MSYLVEHGFIELQKSFLEGHLFTWVSEYCNEVQKHAQTTFYKDVAVLLKEFIFTECEEFGIKKDR
jgi:TorA maturation chaperone TorD